MTGAQHDNFPAEPTGWVTLTPTEKREQVRQAVQIDGLTYTQAATKLGATSREAIAGVVERARKSATPIISNSGQRYGGDHGRAGVKKPKAKPRPKPAFLRKLAPLLPAALAKPEPVRTDVWTALPGSSPVAIEAHREGGCRWPLGEDRPFLYCNEVVVGGKVYCADHCDMAYRAPPARARP